MAKLPENLSRIVASRVAMAHLLATCFSMIMHSVNITMPWTLGPYMVRHFLEQEQTPAGAQETGLNSNITSASAQNETLRASDSLEAKVGTLVGVLAASFSVSQFVTAYAWGKAVERMGSKSLIVVSHVTAAAFNLGLGLSSSYTLALVMRFASGLFNCITGALKTNIAQSFALDDQATVMGLTMSCWALGSIVGPLLGGVLAQPCTTGLPLISHSGLCSNHNALLNRLPFLLPFALSSLFCGLCGLCTVFAVKPPQVILSATGRVNAPGWSTAPCGPSQSSDHLEVELSGMGPHDCHEDKQSSEQLAAFTDASTEVEAAATDTDALLAQKHPRTHTLGPGMGAAASPESALPALTNAGEDVWWRHGPLKLRLAGYCGLAFLFTLVAESIPIFASMPVAHGGLALDSTALSFPFGVGGIFLMFSSVVVFPRLHGSLGSTRTVLLGLWILAPVLIAFPCTSLISSHLYALQVTCLSAVYSVFSICLNLTFSTSNLMVNESALKAGLNAQLGSINGTGHMLGSLSRVVGPFLSGSLWSLMTTLNFSGSQFVPWVLMVAVVMLQAQLYMQTRD